MPDSAIATRPDIPDLIARYAAGEPVPELAQESGVHRATLYRWMLAGIGDQNYEALVTHALVQRVAEADEALRGAREACDVTRARETAKFARMDLERRRPHLYGQRSHLTIEHVGDLAAELRAAQARVIEGEVVREVPIAATQLPQCDGDNNGEP